MRIKNQTTKKRFTIEILMENERHTQDVVDRRVVEAENAREAIKLAYKNIFSE